LGHGEDFLPTVFPDDAVKVGTNDRDCNPRPTFAGMSKKLTLLAERAGECPEASGVRSAQGKLLNPAAGNSRNVEEIAH
jgi:hypothetical protein